jgi:hypothetical protein
LVNSSQIGPIGLFDTSSKSKINFFGIDKS